jgi:histidinol-phosphate/aromatic aminotransferase/cobyric acid decarboxylase-like protein
MVVAATGRGTRLAAAATATALEVAAVSVVAVVAGPGASLQADFAIRAWVRAGGRQCAIAHSTYSPKKIAVLTKFMPVSFVPFPDDGAT